MKVFSWRGSAMKDRRMKQSRAKGRACTWHSIDYRTFARSDNEIAFARWRRRQIESRVMPVESHYGDKMRVRSRRFWSTSPSSNERYSRGRTKTWMRSDVDKVRPRLSRWPCSILRETGRRWWRMRGGCASRSMHATETRVGHASCGTPSATDGPVRGR